MPVPGIHHAGLVETRACTPSLANVAVPKEPGKKATTSAIGSPERWRNISAPTANHTNLENASRTTIKMA
jgi:hypothetical protein